MLWALFGRRGSGPSTVGWGSAGGWTRPGWAVADALCLPRVEASDERAELARQFDGWDFVLAGRHQEAGRKRRRRHVSVGSNAMPTTLECCLPQVRHLSISRRSWLQTSSCPLSASQRLSGRRIRTRGARPRPSMRKRSTKAGSGRVRSRNSLIHPASSSAFVLAAVTLVRLIHEGNSAFEAGRARGWRSVHVCALR